MRILQFWTTFFAIKYYHPTDGPKDRFEITSLERSPIGSSEGNRQTLELIKIFGRLHVRFAGDTVE